MPRFALSAPPTEALDAAVRAAFGLWSVDAADRVRINAYTFVALDALRARLLEVHRPRDRAGLCAAHLDHAGGAQAPSSLCPPSRQRTRAGEQGGQEQLRRCERAYYVRRAGESVASVDRLDPTAFVMIE